jgi:hypothetical protein
MPAKNAAASNLWPPNFYVIARLLVRMVTVDENKIKCATSDDICRIIAVHNQLPDNSTPTYDIHVVPKRGDKVVFVGNCQMSGHIRAPHPSIDAIEFRVWDS